MTAPADHPAVARLDVPLDLMLNAWLGLEFASCIADDKGEWTPEHGRQADEARAMILASHAALTDRLARAEAALEATARGCEAAVGAFEHNNAIDWNELDVAALAARAYFAALAEGGAKEGET